MEVPINVQKRKCGYILEPDGMNVIALKPYSGAFHDESGAYRFSITERSFPILVKCSSPVHSKIEYSLKSGYKLYFVSQ